MRVSNLTNIIEEKPTTEKKTFSAEEVRKLLNSDNNELQFLCTEFSISPKNDVSTGKQYFSKKDVKILEKIKTIHSKGKKIQEKYQSGQKGKTNLITTPKQKSDMVNVTNAEINAIVETVISTKNDIVGKLSKVLDEKLEGIDDVVVELIRCKTENEKLKQKLNELTKDSYKLKKEIQSYKPIGLGLYVKSKESNLLDSYENKYIQIKEK